MSLPDAERERIRQRIWDTADRIGWLSLSLSDKTRYYEQWTDDEEIGGVLARYLDKGSVRVYIKDSLIKPYTRVRRSDESRPLRVLNVSEDASMAETYIKPHGRRLTDGRVICWGRADDWKLLLMAAFERAYRAKATPHAVVLENAVGRYGDLGARRMVEDAATRLGIARVVWLET